MDKHTISDTSQHVETGRPVHGKNSLLVLWGLLVGVFLLFNLVYWPIHRHQARTHPARFTAYASSLAAAGRQESATDVLREGIARYNPPCPEVYELMSYIERGVGDSGAALHALLRHDFCLLLDESPESRTRPLLARAVQVRGVGVRDAQARPPESRMPALFAVLDDMQEIVQPPQPDALSSALIRRAAGAFCTAVNMPSPVIEQSFSYSLGVLILSGSVISHGGYIGTTGTQAPLPLLAYSGGGMDGRRGAMLLAGERDYADRRRGMHALLLDGATGAVLQTGVFDLWESADEAARMRRFLDAAPDGAIGMFAVRDEGSACMTPALEAALMNFGLWRGTFANRVPVMVGLRHSFAAIGVKGAAPGTAQQCWSPEYFNGQRGHPVVCAVIGRGTAP